MEHIVIVNVTADDYKLAEHAEKVKEYERKVKEYENKLYIFIDERLKNI